jgi:hypothetical protein
MTLSFGSLIAQMMHRHSQQEISTYFFMVILMSSFLFVKKFVDFFIPRLEESEGKKSKPNRIRDLP